MKQTLDLNNFNVGHSVRRAALLVDMLQTDGRVVLSYLGLALDNLTTEARMSCAGQFGVVCNG